MSNTNGNIFINDNVNKARDIFGLDQCPGYIFDKLVNNDYYQNLGRVLVFKEDIGKLSGFICYKNEITVICINYKRPIGHQNFTLAHEIGHLMLHKGLAFNDEDLNLTSNSRLEKEANEFAAELIYPLKERYKDIQDMELKILLDSNQWLEFGDKIDLICKRYIVSYSMALNNILRIIAPERKTIDVKKNIFGNKAKISSRYDPQFYVGNSENIVNSRYLERYNNLINKTNNLLKNKVIGKATSESVLFIIRDIEEG